MRIGLVGCVKQKALVTAPAAELYVSPLFRARRTYVERSCDRWFILSAKHGLLHPDQPTAPYDEALTKVIRAARRAWSAKVVRQLEQALPTLDGETFEIHAGSAYRDNGLLDALHLAGATVVVPTEGLSLGRQLAWYAATVSSSRSAISARAGEGPLTKWLRGQAPPVTVTFSGLERILGRPLPPSAYRHRAWWSNRQGLAARQWMDAGLHVDGVDMVARRLRLTR
jgi:hypothetical protein